MLRRIAFASVRARKNKGNERLVDARADADLDLHVIALTAMAALTALVLIIR